MRQYPRRGFRQTHHSSLTLPMRATEGFKITESRPGKPLILTFSGEILGEPLRDLRDSLAHLGRLRGKTEPELTAKAREKARDSPEIRSRSPLQRVSSSRIRILRRRAV